MTYVNIMNYDVWGASSTPGPNAPLGDLCGTSWQPQANAQAALKQWTSAGFPASKLLLGLPLYGYVSQSTATGLTGSLLPPSESALVVNEGDVGENGRVGKMNFVNGTHARPVEGVKEREAKLLAANADLRGWYGQQIPFSTIVSSGALTRNADGTYGQAGGFTFGASISSYPGADH